MIRVLLTGGGSGGHVYPLIAVARKLRELADQQGLNIDIRYYGVYDVFSLYLIGEDIPIKKISGGKLRRYFSVVNILEPFRLFWGTIQALWKVFWFMPDVAFSKGGPGALPTLMACRWYHIPIIIHDSDSVPGMTSQVSGRKARVIELGFAGAAEYFKPKAWQKIRVVGNPVRNELLRPLDQGEARYSFGLEPTKKTLFIYPGSQGSVRINDFIFENLPTLLVKYQIIHHVGTQNYSAYAANFPKLPDGYFIAAYFEKNLAEAYAAADLIIARAGAATIAELAACGKPAILIPLPEAAQDHQRRNAYEYSKTGAAVVIEEANLLPTLFEGELERLFAQPEQLQKMAVAAKAFYKANAAQEIATDILEVVLKK